MKLEPFSPDYFIINKLPITYDPTVKARKWAKFLSEVVEKDQDKATLQEYVGMCLVLHYKYQKALMIVGKGSNGKSVFLKVVAIVLGKGNTTSLSLQNLCNNRFATARLHGKLANICFDVSNIPLEETGMFKMLFEDQITAEFKFKDSFEFENYAKLMFSANEVPLTADESDAFYRRWIILVFPHIFVEMVNADEELFGKLTTPTELSGIFNWALRGLKRLRENRGFTYPLTTKEIKGLYQRKSSNVSAFLQDRCNLSPEHYEAKDLLYEKYVEYCFKEALPPKTKNKFCREVPLFTLVSEARIKVGDERERVWRGVGLK